jgi:hypothetical protein
MHLSQAAVATICVLGMAGAPVLAQNGAQSGAATPKTVGTAGTIAPAQVDVSKLPIDMSRIRRQLVRVNVREERDGLRLRYMVDVFAQAPGIDLFPSGKIDPNFWTGPAPYGAPAHRDFLNLWTPQEHRGRAADFGSLFRWLSDKSTGEKNTPKK